MQQEKFFILKTVKLTIKNILTQLRILKVLRHNAFVAMPWFTKRQCWHTADTVWSTSPGSRLPTPDATHSSQPPSLHTNMTHGLPNRHPISVSKKGRKNRKTALTLFSPNTFALFCPGFLEARQHSPHSPIKIMPMLVTTEVTSSSPRCLKAYWTFSLGKLQSFLEANFPKDIEIDQPWWMTVD